MPHRRAPLAFSALWAPAAPTPATVLSHQSTQGRRRVRSPADVSSGSAAPSPSATSRGPPPARVPSPLTLMRGWRFGSACSLRHHRPLPRSPTVCGFAWAACGWCGSEPICCSSRCSSPPSTSFSYSMPTTWRSGRSRSFVLRLSQPCGRRCAGLTCGCSDRGWRSWLRRWCSSHACHGVGPMLPSAGTSLHLPIPTRSRWRLPLLSSFARWRLRSATHCIRSAMGLFSTRARR
mmetsp:Transcript_27976/g.85377  ORF Transcript_27976/g.85377 Transcript_27976/m.85377 type:complete len:234 (+) Transcript_27976:376-1077(+)